jgi:hypothetical protein
MDELRKILEFTVSEKDFESFMRANRSLMVSEIVATAEDMLYTDKEVGTICRIFVKKKVQVLQWNVSYILVKLYMV